MTTILVSNNASSNLAGSITNIATTANLAIGSGVEFPTPSAGQYYIGSFKDAATGLLTEIVHVTVMTSDTITTMVRAQEGTTAQPWAAGDLFLNQMTAGGFQALAQAGDTQAQAGNYVADTGTANAYVAVLAPAVLAYAAGLTVRLLITSTNTTASTVNVNGLGAKNILKPSSAGPTALTGGELVATQVAELLYDGTQFQLVSVYTSATVANSRLNAWGGMADGSANAITLTDSPVLASYAAGQQISFIAAHNNTGATTINADGLGTKNIFKVTGAGPVALTGGEIITNNLIVVTYDGAEFQLVGGSSTSVAASAGPTRNLIIKNNTSTPNTKMDVSADAISVFTAGGAGALLTSVAVTIDATTTGANGLDTGSLANSTWYAIYIIYNGSSIAGLMSTNGTTPTLPGGYTYYTRYGWVQTDTSAHLLNNGCTLLQKGLKAQYVNTGSGLPTIVTGSNSNVYTAVAVGGAVPPTASGASLVIVSPGGGNVQTAPNANYGLTASTTNPAPSNQAQTNTNSETVEFLLETTNIYYSSNSANGGVFCLGWEDNL